MNTEINICIVRILNFEEDYIERFNTLRDKGTEWDKELGTKYVQDLQNSLFLAFVDNLIVGFLTAHRLQRLDKKKAEVLLYEISVSEKFRQKGVGKALIQRVKDWARELGADNVWVLTNRSNIAAMALYQSVGGTVEANDEQMFTFKI